MFGHNSTPLLWNNDLNTPLGVIFRTLPGLGPGAGSGGIFLICFISESPKNRGGTPGSDSGYCPEVICRTISWDMLLFYYVAVSRVFFCPGPALKNMH